MSYYYSKASAWQELFASFGRKYLRVKFVTKMRKFLPTFRVSLKISWEPGSLAPGEYPTLLDTSTSRSSKNKVTNKQTDKQKNRQSDIVTS